MISFFKSIPVFSQFPKIHVFNLGHVLPDANLGEGILG